MPQIGVSAESAPAGLVDPRRIVHDRLRPRTYPSGQGDARAALRRESLNPDTARVDLARRVRGAMGRPASGGALREQIHDLLRQATGASWVGSWATDQQPDGTSRFVDLSAIGSPSRVDASQRLEGAVAPAGSIAHPGPERGRWQRRSLDLARPHPALVNRFSRLDEDVIRADWSRQPTHERFYAPLEAVDQLRIVIYSGRRFVRWLACLRCGRPDLRFSERTAHRLKKHSALVAEAFVAAAALDRAALLPTARCVAVLDDEGNITARSDDLAHWLLVHGGGADLGARVKSAGSASSTRTWFAGWRVELSRLAGADGGCWLLEVQPSTPTLLVRTVGLSPRQREVAEFLVVGATYAEIARTLEISPHTVKFHARRVYEALDVATRSELFAAWNHPED